MRSCAFLILEAATISIALVILRVFCTLRIFIRISLVPGIRSARLGLGLGLVGGAWRLCGRSIRFGRGCRRELRRVLLPVFDRRLKRLLVVGGGILLFFHGLHQRG